MRLKNSKKQSEGINRLIQLSGERKTILFLGAVLSVLGTLVQLTPYLSVYQVMAELLHHTAMGVPLDTAFIIRWAFYGMGGLLAGYMLAYAGGMMSHTFAYRTVCSVRLKVAEHIGKLPMGYVTNHAAGRIKQILDADVEQMEAFLAHQFPDFLSTAAMLIVLFAVMVSFHVWMALACLFPIIAGFGSQFAVMSKLMKSGALKDNFDALENVSSSSLQYVKGMPSIKIFGQTVKSFRKFYDNIISYRDFTIHLTETVRPGYVRFRVFVLSLATFIVPVGLLIFLKNPENLSFIVTFIFFLILGPAASTPILKMRSFSESINTIKESVNRVDAVLNEGILSEPEFSKIPSSYDISFRDVSFVFQDSFLFSDTIYNNIALGRPDASREAVERAAKAAQCHEFIMALPDGYDTKIGDGGIFLSGGEQQRVSIARAILKNAPILILDEATASTDAENEYKMQNAIRELIKNKTVIMIAHRLSTICNASQILVISDGTIHESGTHRELLEKNRLYASMWAASMYSAAWMIDTGKKGDIQ